MAEEPRSLEYTSTWIVASVCFVIVLISLIAERGLHRLGKCLKRRRQDALFDALEKLKEELMLLGFISLLLTVFQGLISHICIPTKLASYMLPCTLKTAPASGSEHHHIINFGRKLLASDTSSQHCSLKHGNVPLLSLEALHQLHIFIFVLAVVHVIFCVTTMVLGGAKIRQWKHWETSIRSEISRTQNVSGETHHHHHQIFMQRATIGYWRKTAVVSWLMSFFKQFYGSVTKSDYIALRLGFIRAHCPSLPHFDFHNYIMRTLEVDFKRLVGISWYFWLFVVVFLLLNIEGWHTYFWLSFLPLVLLLLVGAKLEHIITRLAGEAAAQRKPGDHEAQSVKPSDEHFWFKRPKILLYLIHFILFQNAFEIAFFFWIWTTYGFHSCIMEKVGYIVPRLIIGVIVQVLCSYSTLPLYALVTQMGNSFKQGMFDQHVHELLLKWASGSSARGSTDNVSVRRMATESSGNNVHTSQQPIDVDDEIRASIIELSSPNPAQSSPP